MYVKFTDTNVLLIPEGRDFLASFVNKITSHLNNKAYFVFQNPDRADRNEKYKKFKKDVPHEIEASDTQRIYYKNNSNSTFEPSNEVVNYEILSL